MKRIKLFSDFGKHDFLLSLLKRQSIGFVGNTYKHLNFVNDDSYEHAVCFNYPAQILKTAPEKNHCFVMEPPEIWALLEMKKLDQIGHYYTPVKECLQQLGVRGKKYPMAVLLHTLLPEVSLKTKKISMIVSAKTNTPFQQKRFRLLQALLRTNLDIDFYGRALPFKDKRIKGELPSLNKSSGLLNYVFSIACENTSHPDCISEKFYDCVVNDCIPISNAPGAVIKYQNSCIYLDFNKSIEELVQIITKVYNWDSKQIANYKTPLSFLKKQFIEGDLSLINKISDVV
jgi:hypothetical protein